MERPPELETLYPKKRARFGIESYRLCEASSGYVWNILTYTGKDTELATIILGKDVSKMTKPTRVVLSLAEKLLNKGYRIVTDNYYTSPELLEILCHFHTDGLGTVRVNRKGLPAEVLQKKLTRYECTAAYKNKLMCLRWKDKKDVTMLSTTHANDVAVVRNKRGENYEKPVAIVDYNNGMGGVDLSDQYLITYSIARKRLKKYYQKMFRHMIDVAMLNSYILYKKNGGTLSHLNFRLEVINSLFLKYGTHSKKTPTRLDIPSRLTGRHFPVYNPPSGRRNYSQRKCVVCRQHDQRKDTSVHCEQCEVALCISPCFKLYHTLQNY